MKFFPPLFHPNVYPCGKVCLDILDEAKAWRAATTLKTMLSGIQDLLDNPNVNDPAQQTAYKLYKTNPAQYRKRVEEEARKNPPPA